MMNTDEQTNCEVMYLFRMTILKRMLQRNMAPLVLDIRFLLRQFKMIYRYIKIDKESYIYLL